MLEANWPETEEDSLNLHHQEQPESPQSSMSPSSDLNIADTTDAAAVPDSHEDDAISIEAFSDSAVSHMAAEFSASSGRSTPPRPATAAGGSSPAPLPADRPPRKR